MADNNMQAYAHRGVQTDSEPQSDQKPSVAHTKYPGLARSRPSEPISPMKRVFSLPETTHAQHVNSARVVSMPEALKSDNSATVSSECVDTSSSFSSYGSMHRTSQSPSPPTSPDSVMITGRNKVQVTNKVFNGNMSSVDGDGWIDWTNSPPKPIPALHGPSSLPYARCPSGAEGTIIDGEDVRMIWGLDPNDQQPATRVHPTQKSPRFELPARMQAISDDVITLADEHLFHPTSEEGRQQQWNSVEPDVIHLGDLPIYNHPNGLGLDWKTFQRLNLNTAPPPDFNNKSFFSLKPTAPAFVPSTEMFEDTSPRIFVEPRSGQCILPAGQRSALELARQYQAKQRQAVAMLPTPPSSSCSQWSPHFNQVDHYSGDASYPDDPFQYQEHRIPPNLNNYNDELRNFVFDHLTMDTKPFVSCDQQGLAPFDSPVLKQPRIDDLSPPHPRPPPNSPLPPLPSASVDIESHLRARLARFAPPSPTSPDLRPRPQVAVPPGRQPRSVPFARLIQRRQLASVPEEEYAESMTPSPSMKTKAGPLNPFSSNPFRLPDISNSVRSRSPSPTKSALKKKNNGPGDSSLQWRRASGQPRTSEEDKENGSTKPNDKSAKRRSNKKPSSDRAFTTHT